MRSTVQSARSLNTLQPWTQGISCDLGWSPTIWSLRGARTTATLFHLRALVLKDSCTRGFLSPRTLVLEGINYSSDWCLRGFVLLWRQYHGNALLIAFSFVGLDERPHKIVGRYLWFSQDQTVKISFVLFWNTGGCSFVWLQIPKWASLPDVKSSGWCLWDLCSFSQANSTLLKWSFAWTDTPNISIFSSYSFPIYSDETNFVFKLTPWEVRWNHSSFKRVSLIYVLLSVSKQMASFSQRTSKQQPQNHKNVFPRSQLTNPTNTSDTPSRQPPRQMGTTISRPHPQVKWHSSLSSSLSKQFPVQIFTRQQSDISLPRGDLHRGNRKGWIPKLKAKSLLHQNIYTTERSIWSSGWGDCDHKYHERNSSGGDGRSWLFWYGVDVI